MLLPCLLAAVREPLWGVSLSYKFNARLIGYACGAWNSWSEFLWRGLARSHDRGSTVNNARLYLLAYYFLFESKQSLLYQLLTMRVSHTSLHMLLVTHPFSNCSLRQAD